MSFFANPHIPVLDSYNYYNNNGYACVFTCFIDQSGKKPETMRSLGMSLNSVLCVLLLGTKSN